MPRRSRQPGGQLGAVASVLGPIVAKEVAKVVVPKIRKQLGFGLTPAGRGLKLAGQGPRRKKKRMTKRMHRRKPRPRMRRPQIIVI